MPLFGENSAIDGAVLGVILRKAEAIQKATGVSVPMPEDREGVTAALMQAMLLRRGGSRAQRSFDFGGAPERLEAKWRDAEENAKASRARYAQGAMRPEEVLPEWRAMRALNGGPSEVGRFTDRALKRIGTGLETRGSLLLAHLDHLPEPMKDRLEARGLHGTRRIAFEDNPLPGVMHVGRVHPLVATLAETLTEGALDPQGSAIANPLGRAGVWRTRTVSQMTTLLLLRLRFKLVTSGRSASLMLAEEATGLAFGGMNMKAIREGLDALTLLETEAAGNITDRVRQTRLEQAVARLPGYEGAIRTFAEVRGQALSTDHLRLTDAARGGVTVVVTPVLPADVIGLYVLLPEGE